MYNRYVKHKRCFIQTWVIALNYKQQEHQTLKNKQNRSEYLLYANI